MHPVASPFADSRIRLRVRPSKGFQSTVYAVPSSCLTTMIECGFLYSTLSRPSALTISLYGQPADHDLIRRFEDAGAIRVIVRPATVQTDGEMADQLQRIAETVLR